MQTISTFSRHIVERFKFRHVCKLSTYKSSRRCETTSYKSLQQTTQIWMLRNWMHTTQSRVKTCQATHCSVHNCNKLRNNSVRHSSSSLRTRLTMKNDLVKRYVLHLREKYNVANDKVMTGERHGRERIVQLTLGPTIALVQQYLDKESEVVELESLIKESSGEDKEIVVMAQADIRAIKTELQKLDEDIVSSLVPLEAIEEMDIIIELSSGVGGQESMLFTSEVFNMYEGYAAYRGWEFEVKKIEHGTETGGCRFVSAEIRGQGVYRHMKFEGGVHRVQRIPKTERQSRTHTSTMAVAIMPLPSEIDIVLHPKDLQITKVMSSGAGGQSVQTTMSCVRIVHIPTGIVAECQTQRSGEKNRMEALQILRSRIYAKELEEERKLMKNKRKVQVGTMERSEKIRTYQYHQDRITDHRLGDNMYGVERFLSGGEDFHELVNNLLDVERKEKLVELLDNFNEQEKQKSTSKKHNIS